MEYYIRKHVWCNQKGFNKERSWYADQICLWIKISFKSLVLQVRKDL